MLDCRMAVNYIKFLMYNNNCTSRELCRKIDVPEPTMCRWLRHQRKMPFDMIIKCLEQFGYTIYINKRRTKYDKEDRSN